MTLPLVSVIINTKNEEKNITACLESIKKQDYPAENIEIVIVDHPKTSDNTRDLAKKYTDKIFVHGFERSGQRNFGAKTATGKYLLFIDADMRLSSKVISLGVKLFNTGGWRGLYIPEIILGRGFWGKVRNFERSFYDGTVVDAVRFVRKEDFLKVKGFDESLTGPEDWDFDKKVRSLGKTATIKSPLHHNETEFNVVNYLRKKSYYGGSFEKYVKKWGKNDPDIKKQFSFWYRYFGVFLENGKWKKLLAHPVLTLGVYFLRILVGAGYIKNQK